MRPISLVGLGLGVALVLSACSGAPGVEDSDGLPEWAEFDGEVQTIEPLDSIEGAERVVVEGVGIDVPPGASAEEVALSDEVTQLVITSEGRERADAIVTVTRPGADAGAVTDADVLLGPGTSRAQIDPAALRDVEEFGAEWSSFPLAAGMRGEVDTGDGEFREFFYVVTRDDAGSRMISISCEAPDDAVEDSLGYQLLRTVRVDGR